MELVLDNFIKVLREKNLKISPSETLDAVEALKTVGISDKNTLKEALATCLAKSREDKNQFYQCFEMFFSMSKADSNTQENNENDEKKVISGPIADMLSQQSLEELVGAIYQSGNNVNIQNIRLFTQRGVYTRRILEDLGIEQLRNNYLMERSKE